MIRVKIEFVYQGRRLVSVVDVSDMASAWEHIDGYRGDDEFTINGISIKEVSWFGGMWGGIDRFFGGWYE